MFGFNRSGREAKTQNKDANKPIKKSKGELKVAQEILNIEEFKDNTVNNKYYIRINPKNITILTLNELLGIIDNFKKVLDLSNSIEVCVVDKTERIEDNKEYLKELRERKESSIERDLLSQDITELDRTFSRSSSREFYLIFPYKDDKEKELIAQFEKTIENQGFEVIKTEKYDIKNMLQVYFERNFSNEVIKDFDI